MLKRNLHTHRVNKCPMRKFICLSCKEEGTYKFITTGHRNTCLEIELQCRNTGCKERVKRRKMAAHIEACPKQVIECPFIDMGCKVTPKREDLPAHVKEDITAHMDTMAKKIDMLIKQTNQVQVHSRDVAPIVIKFTDLSIHSCYSDGFYTGIGGYKVRLEIYPNGDGAAESTHLSVYINLMPGVNDDALEFPLRGTFTITLLNQLEDDNHYTMNLRFDGTSYESSGRKYKLDDSGLGYFKFISNSSLDHNQNRNTKYLHENTVYFRVTVNISSKTKPWLTVM